jgi:hypothetical protein
MVASQQSVPLRGVERHIVSTQKLIKLRPADSQKALPPDPPLQYAALLRRSSSIYTRATDVWDEEEIDPKRSHPEQERFSASSSQLTRSPESPLTPWATEMINPIPPLLQPRNYEPLLPSPSPSLAPQSRTNSFVPSLQIDLSSRESEQKDNWCASLTPSPPLSIVQPVGRHTHSSSDIRTQYSTALPARVRARSVSPVSTRLKGPFHPPVVHKQEASISKALASLGITAEEAGISRGRQRTKKMPRKFLDYTCEYRFHLFEARLLSIFSDRMARTSHGATRVQATGPRMFAASDDVEQEQEKESKEETKSLSTYYHQALVDQYRELAAPVQGQRDHSSEDDEKGRDLRLVPAPLFWKNRQQELYPRRVEHFLAKKEKEQRSRGLQLKDVKEDKQKGESTASAPLEMTLASQLKDHSGEHEREGLTTLKAPARSFFKSRYRESSRAALPQGKLPNDSLRSPFRQTKKATEEPPLALKLPSIAYSHSSPSRSPYNGSIESASESGHPSSPSLVPPQISPMKSLPTQAHPFFHQEGSISPRYISGKSAASGLSAISDASSTVLPDTLKEIEKSLDQIVNASQRSPRFAHKKKQSASTTYSHQSSSSYQTEESDVFSEYTNSASTVLRAISRSPNLLPNRQQLESPTSNPSTPPPKSDRAASKGVHSVFHKVHSTPSPNRSGFSHGRKGAVSLSSTESKEPTVTFDSMGIPRTHFEVQGEQEKESSRVRHRRNSSSSRPKFIEKALGAKREREQQKRRKELKASIKFVGQTDPDKVEVSRGRRETFGADWV